MKRIFLTGGSGFIGSEIALLATRLGYHMRNYDLVTPGLQQQAGFWVEGDVRNLNQLSAALVAFEPDIIIHLASDTDVSVSRIEEFSTTIEGTRNVLSAARALPSLKRLVHISTQFVVRPGINPADEHYLEPYTVYGEAKAKTERMMWNSGLSTDWLIVRPTIIWGPRHPSFHNQIFRHMARRNYLHPYGSSKIMRAFGYVTNTADQILQLALLDHTERRGLRVLYAGDATMDYDVWADAFSKGLTGKPARRVPTSLLRTLGIVGDILKACHIPSPIDSGRAFRMSTSSAIDLGPTLDLTGSPKVGFKQGVDRTLEWLTSLQPQ